MKYGTYTKQTNNINVYRCFRILLITNLTKTIGNMFKKNLICNFPNINTNMTE